MKGQIVRRWSILGVVLLCVSAITAATIPDTEQSKMTAADGDLTDSGDGMGILTCSLTDIPTHPCEYSKTGKNTITTTPGQDSDDLDHNTTENTEQ